MSRVTTTSGTDFSAFEAQFDSTATTGERRGLRRTAGWVGAAVVSVGLWGAIVAGILSLVHAL